ncbi:uncharacterized protein CANTADRAFT_3944 [Suhomyces tanzawaensis NRRL Y-17324]|uniref:Uncharacterized protein n=1 Tax=Suhomyces tanzawaensis NRRL Y-17324 TaxID=984487 RepID=A0A1E4SQU5_9ASCO|nr:uncharacterized protein CANTADRAFT_3944 [Suhomyces tanzawaensis NRRL Y-17324]ODV81886.1 hypothetical protein CANTADRAFT_3944 [Suhomyces tanzawaensis NRRL Y-17324]
MALVELSSLGQLPSSKEFKEKYTRTNVLKVSVYVHLLAVFRDKEWNPTGPGAVVFTDYTPVKESAIIGKVLPPSVPRSFRANGRQLDQNYLHALSLSHEQFRTYSGALASTYGVERERNMDAELADLQDLGILAKVQFRVIEKFNSAGSGMSGYTNSIEFITRELLAAYTQDSSFKNFIYRFKSMVSDLTYLSADKRLGLNSFLGDHSSRSPAPIYPDSQDISMLQSQRVQEPAYKKKRISGAALIHAPANFEEEELGSQMTSSQLDRPVHSNQFMSQSSESIINPTIQNSQGTENLMLQIQVDEVLIDKVTIAKLNAIADTTKVLGDKVFAIDTRVMGMAPLIPIIVKPYGRTMKVTSFKLILKDASGDQMYVEFHEERDICAFLGVNEVEELIDLVEDVEERTLNLVNSGTLHHHRDVRVKRKWLQLPGYKYGYWTIVGTLRDLTKDLD